MNRYRKNEKAVSPVIATILMVAITVVLAGVLVVYLQTLPSGGGEVETTLGLRADKNQDGDWVVSVVTGSKNAGDVRLQVMNKDGSTKLNIYPLTTGWAGTPEGKFNDNNNNSKIDAGDTILLYTTGHQGGADLSGLKLQLLKGESIIGTIKELPA